ncbi:Nodal modulator, partial [Thalictrum thalictroides]
VTSKRYTVVAEKDHYKFKSLENFMVLPNMASVPDIRATYYDICGLVRMIGRDSTAKVTLTHGPENAKPQVKQTDENGSFCFEVPPGEYRLSSFSSKQESGAGLLFVPPYVDIIVNSPILNVEFSQAQVNLYGTVLCKEKCGPAISVSLVRSSSNSREDRKTVGLTDESSDFMFPKVFPGKYRLVAKSKSSLAASHTDNWCWEQSSIDIDVGTEDIAGIVFVQKGFWVHIISTHDADAVVQQPDASVLNLEIKKGSQRICVESPGAHEIHFIKSCIFFGSSIVKFDTTNPLPIHLKAEKYLLEGKILVDACLHANVNELSESIIVDTVTTDGEVINASPAQLVSHGNDITTSIVYEYSIWANLGDELTLVPRDS